MEQSRLVPAEESNKWTPYKKLKQAHLWLKQWNEHGDFPSEGPIHERNMRSALRELRKMGLK